MYYFIYVLKQTCRKKISLHKKPQGTRNWIFFSLPIFPVSFILHAMICRQCYSLKSNSKSSHDSPRNRHNFALILLIALENA